MTKRKILLLVEGSRAEPQLFNHIYKLYGINDIEIISFCTNIYALYDALKKEYTKNENIPFDSIDLPLFLGSKISEDYQDLKFTEIILIFDFDPHDHRYSETKIKLLIEKFNDAQGIGQLYLNYPMLESFKDLDSWNDTKFATKRIKFCKKTLTQYKKSTAATSCYQKQIKKMTDEECQFLITSHKEKLLSVVKHKNLYENIYRDFCLLQLDEIHSTNSFYILNTSIIHFNQEYGTLLP